RLPLMPQQRAEIEARLTDAKNELEKSKREYEQRLREGKLALARGDANEAFRSFERAADIADDQMLPWGFVEEQQLELARANLPHQTQKVAKAMDFRSATKRRRAGPELHVSEAIIGGLDTFTA